MAPAAYMSRSRGVGGPPDERDAQGLAGLDHHADAHHQARVQERATQPRHPLGIHTEQQHEREGQRAIQEVAGDERTKRPTVVRARREMQRGDGEAAADDHGLA
jgi:hypothetical protein